MGSSLVIMEGLLVFWYILRFQLLLLCRDISNIFREIGERKNDLLGIFVVLLSFPIERTFRFFIKPLGKYGYFVGPNTIFTFHFTFPQLSGQLTWIRSTILLDSQKFALIFASWTLVVSLFHFHFLMMNNAGLLTWSRGATLVDIEAELNTLSDCAPPGEEARGGECWRWWCWWWGWWW